MLYFPFCWVHSSSMYARWPWGTMVCHYWSRSITWCFWARNPSSTMLEQACCVPTVVHDLFERACDVLRNPGIHLNINFSLLWLNIYFIHGTFHGPDEMIRLKKIKMEEMGFQTRMIKLFVCVCVREKWDDEVSCEVAVCSGGVADRRGIKYRNGILGNINVNIERRKCYFIWILLWNPSNQEWHARREFLSLLIFSFSSCAPREK